MLERITRYYARLHELIHEVLHLNIPGLGILLRAQKQDRILLIGGKPLYFNHLVADNYARLFGGRFNEPETHAFIRKALKLLGQKKAIFVDVGANIGEFVLDFGDHISIETMWAFEPQREQFRGIQETLRLNPNARVIACQKAVSDRSGLGSFRSKGKNATSSGLLPSISAEPSIPVETTTLDQEITPWRGPIILLIDAEGAELLVMKGAVNLISKNHPLIIFEYNYVTKKIITIDEVRNFLGNDYNIRRLTADAQLATDLSDSWNLVAIHRNSQFSTLLDG